jgi:hypothetical protein
MKSIHHIRPNIVAPLLLGVVLAAGILWACFDAWSPSICFDFGGACLWTQELSGTPDNPPDLSSQNGTCYQDPDSFGVITYFSSFGGSTWLYLCCSSYDLLMVPEGPTVA